MQLTHAFPPLEASMSGWDNHKIDHVSPSTFNLIARAPDAAVAKLAGKYKFNSGPAGVRGNCIEEMVRNLIWRQWPHEKALNYAHQRYDGMFPPALDKDGNPTPEDALDKEQTKILKNRNFIAPCVELAVANLEYLGVPYFEVDDLDRPVQRRVSRIIKGDGWELECFGFVDFVYPRVDPLPDHEGVVVDLKSTMKMDKLMAWPHICQRWFYQSCMPGWDIRFLYCTNKKFKWAPIEAEMIRCEPKAIEAFVMNNLNRFERMLSSNTAEEIMSWFPSEAEQFDWDYNEEIREAVFGSRIPDPIILPKE